MAFPILIFWKSYVNCFVQSRQTTYVSSCGSPGSPMGVKGRVRCRWAHWNNRFQTVSITISPTLGKTCRASLDSFPFGFAGESDFSGFLTDRRRKLFRSYDGQHLAPWNQEAEPLRDRIRFLLVRRRFNP